MAKCPHCQQILSDEWVKKEGASLMGKSAKGKAKRRKNASDAARLRWDKQLEKQIFAGAAAGPSPKKKTPAAKAKKKKRR
jgi:hypothetical protein